MRVNYNKNVFESLPDSVYTGEMPELPRSRGNNRIYRYVAIAAASAAIIFATTTTILSRKLREVPAQTELIADAEIVYTVNSSLQGNIVLPDSTLVTLNSGSSLRLANDFGTGTRTVYLDGEGYFDVHKDKNVPFLIKTPQDVLVTVTGTKFNLKCFSDGPKFDLTLIQGSVELTTPKNEVIYVEPSQEVVITNDFHNVNVVEAPVESTVWTRGILKFDHTPMSETIAQIERWYGVKVNVSDESIYRSSFTAEFKSETLSEVLDLLCLTSRLDYKVEDGIVSLNPKN